jgi:hypothetical protein
VGTAAITDSAASTALEADDEEQRTTALGLLRYGFDYIDAARIVDESKVEEPAFARISPIPAYFLALHGIELTLKAFLRHRGVSARDLRSKTFGHDALACLRKAKEFGLLGVYQVSKDDHDALAMLLNLNQHQGLRYIKTGAKRFPLWSVVEPFAVRLHQSVAKEVGGRTFSVLFPAATVTV